MNKKLLTIAVGAAIAATPFFAAQAADVKVYGRLEVELFDTDVTDQIIMGDGSGQSRFGFKATEDLGGGLKAIGVWEQKVEVANTAGCNKCQGIIDERQQYVALKGSFGEVAFGRVASAYKMTGGAKFDPFNATFLQARRSGGQSGGTFGANGFNSDMIRYKGKFGSVSVNVQTSLDESSNDGDVHAGVMFKQGPLEVFAAISDDDSTGLGNTKFGARYKFGAFKVWVQSEATEIPNTIRSGSGANLMTFSGDTDFLLLAGSFKFGKTTAVVQLGNAEADGGTDLDFTSIGVIHKFSKKTRVYAGSKTVDAGGGFDFTETGVGIRMDF